MGATKALRMDGYLAIFFFQKNWNIVDNTIIWQIQEAFQGFKSLEDINKTLIVLIAKVDKLEIFN